MAGKNPLEPIPPRTLVLGNLLSLGTTTPIQVMMTLAREYGPIYWLDMMGKPIVVVSGFSLVDELCDETRFEKSVTGALRRRHPAWRPPCGRALAAIHREETGADERAALGWLAGLAAEGRYLVDVWAAG